MVLHDLNNRGSDRKPTQIPEAWRPRLELDEHGGYAVSSPRTWEISDAVEILAEFDLDPNQWRVVSVRQSKWQRYDEEWLHSYRVNVVPAGVSYVPDVDQLADEIRRWKPRKVDKTKGDLTFLAVMGDTQWGKDAGDGTKGTIARVLEARERALHNLKAHRDKVGTIALPQIGDCIEGIVSQGGRIQGRLDLALTAQIRLGRRMLLEWVKTFAPYTDKLIIPVVPGNHDETTRQLITEPTDSFQVDIVAAVLEACGENPELGHVEARFPDVDNTTLAINLSDTLVGFAHGHQARDMVKWWEGQALGATPVGQADILISGHYHHYRAQQVGHRTWIQIPSIDGGSAWFRDRKGYDSPPGLITLTVGADHNPLTNLSLIGV